MALDADALTKWIRERGVLTISCGSRVMLSLQYHNGAAVETEPQETLEAAFAQLKDKARAYEASRVRE